MYFFNVWGKTIYILLKSQSSTGTHDNKICGAKNLDLRSAGKVILLWNQFYQLKEKTVKRGPL